ncbi:DUF4241 domain-containing protein [Nodosilinea sp. AN01ver1]|uniref:DUF4241 domain-containing protein n=1 Tax=Nodosilinea sp. AN01ver1 TaxID=3423362 RepID=UPI003D3101FC
MHTNFQKAFQHGYTSQLDMSYYDSQTVTIFIIEIGSLVLPSGKIVVQDPGNPTSKRYCLQKTIEPGNYPVFLSLACCEPAEDCIITCAKIQISEASPAKWQMAVSDDVQYPSSTYDVDSGTACFMDFETALFIKQAAFSHERTDIVHPLNDFCLECEDDYIQGIFLREMTEKMNENGKTILESIPWNLKRFAWANLFLKELTAFNTIPDRYSIRKPDTNIVAFGAGWGEGEDYSSYWGFDKNGKVCCLVTDFFVFFEKYLEHGEFHERPDIVCDDDN